MSSHAKIAFAVQANQVEVRAMGAFGSFESTSQLLGSSKVAALVTEVVDPDDLKRITEANTKVSGRQPVITVNVTATVDMAHPAFQQLCRELPRCSAGRHQPVYDKTFY